VDGDGGRNRAGCGARNFGEKRMAVGVIKKFIEERGFGFITPTRRLFLALRPPKLSRGSTEHITEMTR
jgi:hypothetical protein